MRDPRFSAARGGARRELWQPGQPESAAWHPPASTALWLDAPRFRVEVSGKLPLIDALEQQRHQVRVPGDNHWAAANVVFIGGQLEHESSRQRSGLRRRSARDRGDAPRVRLSGCRLDMVVTGVFAIGAVHR